MKEKKNCRKMLMAVLITGAILSATLFAFKFSRLNKKSVEKIRKRKIQELLNEADSLIKKNKRQN